MREIGKFTIAHPILVATTQTLSYLVFLILTALFSHSFGFWISAPAAAVGLAVAFGIGSIARWTSKFELDDPARVEFCRTGIIGGITLAAVILAVGFASSGNMTKSGTIYLSEQNHGMLTATGRR